MHPSSTACRTSEYKNRLSLIGKLQKFRLLFIIAFFFNMDFGDYLFKGKTKCEIFSYVTETNGKSFRPQMHSIKESEVQKPVYNDILRN